ncbi:hypothetical protein CLCR_09285 [Cladophialophora carrionii]|uniref:Uncharacterized protein n=1 Tax=Cladophialophora carrionii TaxID=86049 RepID=A0A1C1CU21_9EURO|nr:hypothetical protein CLCR_09285 [Cladophialophora carrionii]
MAEEGPSQISTCSYIQKTTTFTEEEGMPRIPERAYIKVPYKVPYRSPTPPRAGPLAQAADITSTLVSSSSDMGSPQAQPFPETGTNAHLRGGWDEEECCICCVCSCLACDQFCQETSTGSFDQ